MFRLFDVGFSQSCSIADRKCSGQICEHGAVNVSFLFQLADVVAEIVLFIYCCPSFLVAFVERPSILDCKRVIFQIMSSRLLLLDWSCQCSSC